MKFLYVDQSSGGLTFCILYIFILVFQRIKDPEASYHHAFIQMLYGTKLPSDMSIALDFSLLFSYSLKNVCVLSSESFT